MPRLVRKSVACFGSGMGSDGDAMYEKMYTVGRLLARHGVRVITGAYEGSGMEAPVRGAQAAIAKGTTLGYALRCRPKKPNKYLDEILWAQEVLVKGYSSMPEIEYGARLGLLGSADGFVVDPSDVTLGTLTEFFFVASINVKDIKLERAPKPMVVLVGDRLYPFLETVASSILRYPFIALKRTPEQAVKWLIERLV